VRNDWRRERIDCRDLAAYIVGQLFEGRAVIGARHCIRET
jgi:hypothetical protein